MNYLEACEDACINNGIDLTDDEKLHLSEMQDEGLIPSQAPAFITNVRGGLGREAHTAITA